MRRDVLSAPEKEHSQQQQEQQVETADVEAEATLQQQVEWEAGEAVEAQLGLALIKPTLGLAGPSDLTTPIGAGRIPITRTPPSIAAAHKVLVIEEVKEKLASVCRVVHQPPNHCLLWDTGKWGPAVPALGTGLGGSALASAVKSQVGEEARAIAIAQGDKALAAKLTAIQELLERAA